jgi:sulfur carrier protein ThiS
MLSRFYALTQLDGEGRPDHDFRRELAKVASGFAVSVRLPKGLGTTEEGGLVVTEPIANIRELKRAISSEYPELEAILDGQPYNFVVNGEVILRGTDDVTLESGDRVEIIMALSGG